jgi:hypothetical protein
VSIFFTKSPVWNLFGAAIATLAPNMALYLLHFLIIGMIIASISWVISLIDHVIRLTDTMQTCVTAFGAVLESRDSCLLIVVEWILEQDGNGL